MSSNFPNGYYEKMHVNKTVINTPWLSFWLIDCNRTSWETKLKTKPQAENMLHCVLHLFVGIVGEQKSPPHHRWKGWSVKWLPAICQETRRWSSHFTQITEVQLLLKVISGAVNPRGRETQLSLFPRLYLKQMVTSLLTVVICFL